MTDEHHAEYDELSALHALDALEGPDRRRLESHLESCAPCRRRYGEHLGTAAALAGSAEPATPPVGAREALLRRAAAEADGGEPVDAGAFTARTDASRGAPAGGRRGDLLLRIAAVLLLAVATWSLWSQFDLHRQLDRLRERNDALSARLQQSEADLALAQDRLASTSAALATVAAGPETVLVGQLSDDARGRVYAGGDGVLLVVGGLPRPPEGRTYQLWGIVGGTPVSAGLFSTDAGGEGFLWTDSVPAGSVERWAVTEEPAGGVPAPTGDMVLLG